MTSPTFTKGILRPCCADARNLRTLERRPNGITVKVCRICDRRHYRMRADPGQLGMTLGALGKKLGA
jgi:hypothetical protein